MWAALTGGLVTGAVTLVGGFLALRLRAALDLLLGFSAGAIIGVALFDLLPEGLDLTGEQHNALRVTTAVALGFALYLGIDRGALIAGGNSGARRHFAPAALTFHSLLDGLGIGLAFHISSVAGMVVAIGVLAHDVVDGANTVAVSLSSGARKSVAQAWLTADAVAPLMGILLASTVAIRPQSLAMLLGMVAGTFLYIGASELLPRSHADHPRASTIAATAFGLAFIYSLIRLTSIGA